MTSLRVLVVEDNDDAREMLRALLETRGHYVEVAATGNEGVRRGDGPFDIAFLDIGLPDIDGYEVARRLRALSNSMRLVALTGYGGEETRRRAMVAGFDLHMLKPVTVESIDHVLAATPRVTRGSADGGDRRD